jgi:hypothetical protein
MKNFFRRIASSLDTVTKDGYSARKLSAFAIMICVIAAHVAWLKKAFLESDFGLLAEVLMIDYGMISVLLGLTTYENIKNKKSPASEPTGETQN